MSPRIEQLIWEQCVRDYERDATGPSPELQMQLQTIREEAYRRGVEQASEVALQWGQHYPTDVFPDDGKSPDCIAASFARHTCRMVAKNILDLLESDQ